MVCCIQIPVTRIALWVFIHVVVSFRRAGVDGCSVSPPTVVCSFGHCNIFNNQGLWEDRAPCTAANAVFPTTEADLVAAVAEAVKRKQKIKVVSGLAHSHERLVCAGERGLIISTKDYAATPLVNPATAKTITVEAGVVLRDLLDAAAKAGLTFPTSTSWDGVSAAGSVSTGAHGSGLVGKGSAINEYIVAMRLVIPAPASEGYAKVIELTDKDEDLKAARFALGTLGVISKITFALQPMFKRSVSLSLEDDTGIEDRLERFLRKYEFANIYWYIAHGKALMGKIVRAPVDMPGDGINRASGQPSTVFNVEKSAEESEAIQATGDAENLCNKSGKSMINRANGTFLNDGIRFTGYPVVGFNHRMVTAGGCEDYHQKRDNQSSCTANKIVNKNESICSWDRRARGEFRYDLEIRVPLSRAREAILDLKRFRSLDPKPLCALDETGIIMRTIKKSKGAYLGPAEDVVTFEIGYHRSRQGYVPTWNMDVYQEIEQMLIEKHGGSLHWGKSGGHLFEGLAKQSTVNLTQFLKVKERLDPDAHFSNEWTDGLLGIGCGKVEVFKAGCALEKLCKCTQDIHCAPKAGYFCKPGRIWTNARVCRKGK